MSIVTGNLLDLEPWFQRFRSVACHQDDHTGCPVTTAHPLAGFVSCCNCSCHEPLDSGRERDGSSYRSLE